MKWKKIFKFAVFLIYTSFIANSMFFVMVIAYFEDVTLQSFCMYFLILFCQINVFVLIICGIWGEWPFLLASIVVICMEIAIFFYPVLLWWRKRSVFHAWLVAMAGLLMPGYLHVFLFKPTMGIIKSLLLMNAGYAIAWFAERAFSPYRKEPLDSPKPVEK